MMQHAWKRHLGEVDCPRCGAKYHDPEIGSYRCSNCGLRENIEQALVRTCYKRASPDVTKEEIAKFAGIAVERVDIVKRAVKADLDKLEQEKRPCAKCRKSIMYGRYCDQCKKDMVGNMFNAF